MTSHGRFPPDARTDSGSTAAGAVPRSGATPTQPGSTRSTRDPADRGHVPPRDPGQYAVTNHFRQRLREPGRYVSLPMLRETIEHGQLRWNSTDGWRFALVDGGVRFVVVIADEDTSPVVVTGWTEVADWAVASGADQWRPEDLEAIQLRTDLSDNRDRSIPGLIRPRSVSYPIVVGDHRVTSPDGAGFVECVDCERRFRSKAALCSRRCRR